MKAIVEHLEVSQDVSLRVVRRIDSAFTFNWHCHSEYELTLIEGSIGRRFVGDSIEAYQPGDLVLLGPGLPHSWVSGGGNGEEGESVAAARSAEVAQAVVVQFAGDCLGRKFFSLPEFKLVKSAMDQSYGGLCFEGSARSRGAQLMGLLPGLSPLPRLARFIEVLGHLGQAVIDGDVRELASPGFRPTLHRSQQKRIDIVCRYINEHYTQPIEQARVAVLIDMRPAQFSHFFKRSTGRTFVHYVNLLRVGLASRLLLDTELGITDICFRSGYSNISNFNRQFKTIHGMSPRLYRQSHGAGAGARL